MLAPARARRPPARAAIRTACEWAREPASKRSPEQASQACVRIARHLRAPSAPDGAGSAPECMRVPIPAAPRQRHADGMTHITRSIVAGVDGSSESRTAALVANELSTALGDRLVLGHVVDDPLPYPYSDARARELDRRRAVHAGARLLTRAGRDLDAETRVILGDASEMLADMADEEAAELLVVGTRGRSGLAATLVGSVSQGLAVSAGCPVLIVPPGAGERFLIEADAAATIVCGFDGSEGSGARSRWPSDSPTDSKPRSYRSSSSQGGGWHDAPPMPVRVEVGDPVPSYAAGRPRRRADDRRRRSRSGTGAARPARLGFSRAGRNRILSGARRAADREVR